MSHGEFEKQVREKMNEIHLQPSDSVWSRVEHGLDAGKKRRRIIIWVPVMIILGIGLFLLNTPYRQNDTIVENRSVTPEPNTATQKGTTAIDPAAQKADSAIDPANQRESSSVDPAAQKGTSAIDPATQKGTSAIDPAEQRENSGSDHVDQIEHSGSDPLNQRGAGDPDIQRENGVVSSPSAQSVPARPPVQVLPDNSSNETEGKTKEQSITGISPLNQLIGIKPPEAAWKQVLLPELVIKSEKKVVTSQKKKDSKYSFHLNIAGGISQEKDGRLLGMFQSGTADFPTPLYSSPNTRYKPAPIDAGIFLSAGLGVERKLGSRWALKSGLQYSRFSNSIMVGNRMQQERQVFTGSTTPTTISTYYTPAPIRRYTMHYDFVELPLSVLYIPGNGKMKLHAGTSASALISSNALHFDAANGVYFEDNDLLNKMQLSLSAGVKFRVPVNNSNRLYIGPEFRYQFSSLLKDQSNEKHLWSAGIEASWQLNK